MKSENVVRFVDIDETVFHTTACVKICNATDNKLLKSLSNKEWNSYPRDGLVLKTEYVDYAEFSDASKFYKESKPIKPMIERLRNWAYQMRTDSKHYDDMVVFVTARGDFDNREKFLDTFRKQKISIDDTSHFYIARTGNLSDDTRINGSPLSTAQRKKIVFLFYLMAKMPSVAELYDDDLENINDFLELKKEMPSIIYRAFLVEGNRVTEVVSK